MGLTGDLVLRPAVAEDATAIAAIDAEGLATGHATFREMPHDWASFSIAFLEGHGLALVVEADGSVVGWAGVAPTSARAVYRGVGEVSVYVGSNARGNGVGRTLLGRLIREAEAAGFWTLVAQVFPENTSSLAMHAVQGFRAIGTRERLGRMTYGPLAGRWRDVVMLERRSTTAGTG
ncbi:MAG: N-acetyltransferase family protein [Pseudomonadota bacterium]